jgi:type IV secretory pathway TrbD component
VAARRWTEGNLGLSALLQAPYRLAWARGWSLEGRPANPHPRRYTGCTRSTRAHRIAPPAKKEDSPCTMSTPQWPHHPCPCTTRSPSSHPKPNEQKKIQKKRVFNPRHRPQSPPLPPPFPLPPTRTAASAPFAAPARSVPMGYVLSAVARVLEQPTAWGAAREMALLAGPLWAAVLLGLLLGWAWRPRWAAGLVAAPAAAAQPPFATLDFWKAQLPARLRAPLGSAAAVRHGEEDEVSVRGYVTVTLCARWQPQCSLARQRKELPWTESRNGWCLAGSGRSSEAGSEELAVGKRDLANLWRLVEGRDGGPAWIKMMDRSLPTMTYQAWRRDAQVNTTFPFRRGQLPSA